MTWNRKPNSVPRVSDAPLEEWHHADLCEQVARVYEVTNGMTKYDSRMMAIYFTREEAIAFIKRAADVICAETEK